MRLLITLAVVVASLPCTRPFAPPRSRFSVAPPPLSPPQQRQQRQQLTRCRSAEGFYERLQEALTALSDGDVPAAQAAQRSAEAELAAGEGCSEEEADELRQLLAAVSERIGQRAAFGDRSEAGSGEEEAGQRRRRAAEARRAAAERSGDGLVFSATKRFDEKNFTGAVALINEARAAFQGADDGGKLAHDREVGVVGNLYAIVLAEVERQQRMEKVRAYVRMYVCTYVCRYAPPGSCLAGAASCGRCLLVQRFSSIDRCLLPNSLFFFFLLLRQSILVLCTLFFLSFK